MLGEEEMSQESQDFDTQLKEEQEEYEERE